jgi:hypothetical protein
VDEFLNGSLIEQVAVVYGYKISSAKVETAVLTDV